jgi:hypothetical protein
VSVKNACSWSDDNACHGAGISAGKWGNVECETTELQSLMRFPLDPAG